MLIKVLLFFGVLTCFSCSSANNKPLSVNFSADSSAIELKNIDAAGLHQINTGQFAADSTRLITVLEEPSEQDTAGMETEIHGQVALVDQTILFRPDKPFKKGKEYLVITYLNTKFGDVGTTLKGNTSYQVKPNQKSLIR